MRTAGIALAVSAVALGVGVLALLRELPADRAPPRMDRMEKLERQFAELSRDLEILKAGRGEGVPGEGPEPPLLPSRTEPASPGGTSPAPSPGGGNGEIEALVDDAVARKTKGVLDEIRIKSEKKPAIDVFASTLELTDEQRARTERVVVEGQKQVHEILGTPTQDGANLMDQLVELAARGMAEPGKDPGWGLWYGRVLTEKIPGTDETYAARIETVKGRMRAAFKRDWSEAPYEEVEGWGVDPTEIQKVHDSPNDALFRRIADRARTLGAKIPGD
ncbi:MAG TPA: hypothetical protein VFY93_05485 [Planctomycetota bacterium]|nr:hypothetical protein [Planctomycetota bacterium]